MRDRFRAGYGFHLSPFNAMSTPVTYALEGRAVTSDEFFDVIAGGGRQLAIQQMTAKIESVTCTQHGTAALVTEVDQSPEGFGFTISGCCDELIDRAHSAAAYPVDP